VASITRVGIGIGEINGRLYIIYPQWLETTGEDEPLRRCGMNISTKATLFHFWWIILGKAWKLVAWNRVISFVKHLKSHTSLQSRILAFKLSTKLKHFRDICKSCKIRFPDNSIMANCTMHCLPCGGKMCVNWSWKISQLDHHRRLIDNWKQIFR